MKDGSISYDSVRLCYHIISIKFVTAHLEAKINAKNNHFFDLVIHYKWLMLCIFEVKYNESSIAKKIV